jgi:hypothetical protein
VVLLSFGKAPHLMENVFSKTYMLSLLNSPLYIMVQHGSLLIFKLLVPLLVKEIFKVVQTYSNARSC